MDPGAPAHATSVLVPDSTKMLGLVRFDVTVPQKLAQGKRWIAEGGVRSSIERHVAAILGEQPI